MWLDSTILNVFSCWRREMETGVKEKGKFSQVRKEETYQTRYKC